MERKVIDFLVSQFVEEDTPDKFREIIEEIGIEKAVKLSILANGSELYFPKPEALLRNTRNKMIRQEFMKGSSCKELSFKYNLTTVQINRILNQK